MPWLPPKTNWVRTDVFNVDPDWKRIKSNMEYLQAFTRHLFPDIEFDTIPDINYTTASTNNRESIAKTGKPAFPTAEVVNTVEYALQAIKDGTYYYLSLNGSIPRTPNGQAWDHADFNRIESFQQNVYNLLNKQEIQRKHLPFILGGGEFG